MYIRWSKYLLPTWKKTPAEAEVSSHQLMLRAGLIRRVIPGIYGFLPFGYRALRKVERIVREEMDAIGALEMKLPPLLPEELWRWEESNPGMIKFADHKDQGLALGLIHEEIILELVSREISSWRELPLILYQISDKYRGEIRPRFGVMRARRFLMKAAYSFHATWESLEKVYRDIYRAYSRVFTRCGLVCVVAEAPPMVMGESVSHEFITIADTGEDEIALCPSCGYAANSQIAHTQPPPPPKAEERALQLVATPEVRTVEELVAFLGIQPEQVVKTFLYAGREGVIAVLVRGDQELDETKLVQAKGDPTLRRVDDPEEAERISGARFGFLGPIGLSIPVWADEAVRDIPAAVVGGNREGYHYIGAKAERDFRVDRYLDLHRVREGDPCGRCGASLRLCRGFSMGWMFQLGTERSEALEATFLDKDRKKKLIIMGHYGIDLSRLLGAVIEQHHDEEGIIWPVEIAPFHVVVTVLRPDIPDQLEFATGLAEALARAGFEVLVDDRDRSPGEKFHDAKLIGIPVMLVVGPKALKRGEVEAERRRDGRRSSFPAEPAAVVLEVRELLQGECI